ncbi:hypothetical protein EK0264_11975 [Epidermidibacterium keratini]|uniref:DUF3137 domain-containing protein n=1 Tax=Epidermidibacterium keratini TaxID=1891644 RepID=A0A7L4YPH8_9ACTN|nr:hypothetical protein [Epidermidibacterium keratini]QHC00932.1 hypothetical protein EK0264_11975 [Epidermidibacterium keratini]
MDTALMTGLIIVAAIVIIIGSFIWERKRAEKMQAFAASRGLSYAKQDQRWVGIDLGWPYGNGRSHKAKHVMTGEHNGRPLVVFEHYWVTGSGDDRETHHAMVTALQLPRVLPELTVTREGMMGSLARRMGIKDIELESDDFNRAYKIKSPNRKFAYDVLHPRFMEWMLSVNADGFTINSGYLVYATGGRLEIEQVDGKIAYLDTVAERIPSFVWSVR